MVNDSIKLQPLPQLFSENLVGCGIMEMIEQQ